MRIFFFDFCETNPISFHDVPKWLTGI